VKSWCTPTKTFYCALQGLPGVTGPNGFKGDNGEKGSNGLAGLIGFPGSFGMRVSRIHNSPFIGDFSAALPRSYSVVSSGIIGFCRGMLTC